MLTQILFALLCCVSLAFATTEHIDDKVQAVDAFHNAELTSQSVKSKNAVIYGGEDATQKVANFIAHVSIRINSTHGSVCTGVVMNRKVVLTSAHCFVETSTSVVPMKSVVLTIGYRNVENVSFSKKYEASTIDIIPTYNHSTSADDIAAITLKKRLPKGQKKARHTKKVPKTGVAMIAGYGITENSTGPSRVLQQTELKYIPMNECVKIIKIPTELQEERMCFGSPDDREVPTTSCGGDSGAPFFFMQKNGRMLVYALNSHGAGVDEVSLRCGAATKLSIGMKLKSYLTFIKPILKGKRAKWAEIFPENKSVYSSVEDQ